MKAGVIGVVDEEFKYVDSISDTVEEGESEFARALDVQRVFSLPSGDAAFEGVAAREVQRREEVADVQGSEIDVRTETRTKTIHVGVAGVPGEFVVAGNSRGRYAFDLVGKEAGVTVERATLDLDDLFEANGGAQPWRVGVAGGVNGVFHGEDLRQSHDLDGLREDGTLNQLGLAYDYDGEDLKMTATRSGYVEVYQPSSFDTGDYLEYLREQIVPHLGE